MRTVYDFLGAKDRIGLFARAGEHSVAARDLERCIDFLDVHFGRADIPWENTLAFDYDFEEWKSRRSDTVTSAKTIPAVTLKESYPQTPQGNQEWAADRERILENLNWLLGDEPAGAKPRKVAETAPSRVDWIDRVISRPELKRANVLKIGPYNAMGDHLPGYIYYPVAEDGTTRTQAAGKLPVIIYLHQYSYNHGWAIGYYPLGGGSGSTRVLQQMIDSGYAVMAIDMYGFGTRWQEARHFYKRHGEWSKMGKMVADVSACVDAIGSFDFLDNEQIHVVGDTIGGAVGLMAAARDNRIAGVAAVAAFSPWRTSTPQYESIRTFSHLHGFMPRLGLYADNPATVPVDYAEILACIAPRKLMVIAPTLNRHSDNTAVAKTMDQVSRIYDLHGATAQLKVSTPTEINRMTRDMEADILKFLKAAPGDRE